MRLALPRAFVTCAWAALGLLAGEARPAQTVTISPVKSAGQITGFDVAEAGRLVAPVRLSSNSLLAATRAESRQGDGQWLRLTGLKAKEGTGLRLGPEDFVEVSLPPGEKFPEVRFRLTVVAFDPQQWQKNAGRFPLHFLSVSLPEAEVVHQRGWLNATPKADPFPFLLDVHVGTPEICATWSRNWSYAVPIGCYPIPVVGLWAPAAKHYVGYDFLGSRLTDQSERYLATAYCWQEGADRQFIALVYPYAGRGFQTLTYPPKGERIEGHFRLVFSAAMPSTADPNTFLQEDYFRRYAGRLPRVPAMNDLGWMPGGTRLEHLPAAPRGRLVHRHRTSGQFEEAGTVEIGGWTWHRESAVTAAYRRGDREMLDALKQDLAYLKTKVERMTIDGDECLFWPKPIEGKWLDAWGGQPVKTLHNANGWAVGLVLVDFYRHDKNTDYLPLIDGIYNWTKHFVWTRNEFADVPSSPFAIGGTLSAAFLLDYHFAFRDDPQRAERAREAVELARKVTYRYMPIWACDNDRDDNLDASFLWEPNSGRDWVGTACANELHWNLDTLTQVYVNCGDPILHYYLRGSLERWHLLYKDIVLDAPADYPHDALSEWLGLFDGTMAGRGGRASFGTGDILPLHYPAGRSLLRATCGAKAAIACCKDGCHSQIENYRYAPQANFAFTVRSTQQEPFDVTVSFPFCDLTDKAVTIMRQGKHVLLENGKGVVRSPDAPSYVYIRGVRDGDTVHVGQGAAEAPVLPIGNPWTISPASEPQPVDEGFCIVRLPIEAKRLSKNNSLPPPSGEGQGGRVAGQPSAAPLPYDWNDTASYAGLWAGTHYAWGVPYYVEPADSSGRPMAVDAPVSLRVPENSAGTAYVFFSPKTAEGTVAVRIAQGEEKTIDLSDCAIAWSSWPPCFRQRILMAAFPLGAGANLHLTPRDAYLVSVTVLVDAARKPHLAELLARGQSQYRAALAQERILQGLAAAAAPLPAGRIGILPIRDASGPVMNILQRSRLIRKCRRLTPDDLLNPELFCAKNLPVVLNLGGEEYAGSVRKPGDGAEAILEYLRSGGTIAMLTSEPLPFYYDGPSRDARVRSLTPRMGMPIGMGFERPPEGAALRIRLNPAQSLITGVPGEIPFFTEGDLRLRCVRREDVSSDASYTPIFTVRSGDGIDYGDAAAYAEFTRGPFQGGRLLYVWSRLLDDEQLGPTIVAQALHWILAQAAAATSAPRAKAPE